MLSIGDTGYSFGQLNSSDAIRWCRTLIELSPMEAPQSHGHDSATTGVRTHFMSVGNDAAPSHSASETFEQRAQELVLTLSMRGR